MLFYGISLSNAQYVRQNPHPAPPFKTVKSKSLSNDTTFDVKFYHLDLEIALDSSYIQGSVSYLFTSNINGLAGVILDLDSAFTIDSISKPAQSFTFSNNQLQINFSTTYNQGNNFEFTVYYKGPPTLAGGYKGLRYETHDNNELVIASLSTPYLAHTWWPCKDGISDKADSTYIDITIKDTTINSIDVQALSNGLLEKIESFGIKKKFMWKHHYPIVPYYVMVAISNYTSFQQTYQGLGYNFPIDYYVFDSHLGAAQLGTSLLPDVMDFFTSKFGPYPFLNEKYGMTQLGYYGAIENQTNTIINNMSLGWFNVSVHELAHQWFADMITCSSWNHGWLNEGFASYSEALYDEYAHGFNSYKTYMSAFEFYDGGTLYQHDVSNPFTVFQPIIYNKGAYVLHMLRGIMGDSTFFNALYSYSNNPTFRFKHATTSDFQLVCENESNMNLDYFFDQWIYDERYPKYKYNYIFDPPQGKVDISIVQIQSTNGWRSVFAMPIPIKVIYSDGSDTMFTVFNDQQFQTFSFNVQKMVNVVLIDPDDWILKELQFDQSIAVATEELFQDDFILFPNPAEEEIFIKGFKQNLADNLKIILMDLNGQTLYESIHQNSSNQLLSISLKDFPSGIYTIRLIGRETNFSKKIVHIN